MIQQSYQRYVLAVVLALAVLSVGVPATVSAQEQSDNPLDNETATEATDPTEVTEQLGRLVVHDYSYDGGGGVMTIEASWNGNVSTTVTITEMIQMDSGGAKEIGFKRIRIMPDQRRTIKISVAQQNSGSASVIVTTRQSIDAGRALVLQAGDAKDRGEIPFNTASIFVGLSALGGAGLAFAFTYRQYEDESDVDRRDRIA